jgi:protoporphyrinogen oxidase
MQKIVILGAGLTGLSTAYHLEEQNITSYEMYEKNETVGGLTRSVTENGFTVDYTGHFLHSNNEYFTRFLSSLFQETELQKIIRNAHIFMQNNYLPYPFQTNLATLPTNIISECLELFIKRPHQNYFPKNFKQWLLKAFGKGMCDHFFYPYNKKILQYPLSRVMPEQGGRFVPSTNLKDLVENLTNKQQHRVGYNHTFLYPEKNGISELPNKLHAKINKKVFTNHEITGINPHKKQLFFSNGITAHYDILVSTIPLDTLLKKTAFSTASGLNDTPQKLICNTVINLNLGVSRPNLTDKHWMYFPEKQFPFYRLGSWSAISKRLAPENKSSLYAEIALLNPTQKEISRKLVQSKKVIKKLFNIENNELCFEKTLTLDHAYVIYDEWRKNNLENLRKTLKESYKIFSIGRFGEWKYSSMQEAILDGQATTQELAKLIDSDIVLPANKSFKNTIENL